MKLVLVKARKSNGELYDLYTNPQEFISAYEYNASIVKVGMIAGDDWLFAGNLQQFKAFFNRFIDFDSNSKLQSYLNPADSIVPSKIADNSVKTFWGPEGAEVEIWDPDENKVVRRKVTEPLNRYVTQQEMDDRFYAMGATPPRFRDIPEPEVVRPGELPKVLQPAPDTSFDDELKKIQNEVNSSWAKPEDNK